MLYRFMNTSVSLRTLQLFHQSANGLINEKIIVLSLGMSKTPVTWTNFRL